jgi:glycosyltransferase involved in cell wall biosynthesis
MTSIMLVSGSWPPDTCGVGHYSSRLADHLEDSFEVVRFRLGADFGAFSFPRALRQIFQAEPDLIHIQYPSVGYRRSLVPSLIAMLPKVPTVVTLHEFSIFRWYRAPWFMPFKFANALIFTNGQENAAFEERFGKGAQTRCVIPIGSNIPVGRSRQRDPKSLCYFGLFMPGKGLEDFLNLVKLLRKDDFRLTIIGAIPDGFAAYAKQILKQCEELGISIEQNRSDNEVADLMQAITYAYLPFPEGASDKRGSLIAAMVNGLIVLTPHTMVTQHWIKAATIATASPAEAEQVLSKLSMSTDGGRGLIKPEGARPPFDWSEIASRHVTLYRSLLSRQVGDKNRL